IIPTQNPLAGALASFNRSLPASAWLAAVQHAYPSAAGSRANSATTILFVGDMPGLTTQSRSVGSYQDYVFSKARAAGIGPDRDRQTISVLYIPCVDPFGMDSDGCSSHHPTIEPLRLSPAFISEAVLFNTGDAMAVILGSKASLGDATVPTSHELAEAYTD